MYLVSFHQSVYVSCAWCSYQSQFQIQISVGRRVRCRTWNPWWEEQPNGINKQETGRMSYSLPLVQTHTIEQTRSLWDSFCLPSLSLCAPPSVPLSSSLSPSLSLSLPVRAACRGKSSAEGRSVATQFTLPVEFMLLEHLNSRSNSSECVLTSTPKHIQWKYLACK